MSHSAVCIAGWAVPRSGSRTSVGRWLTLTVVVRLQLETNQSYPLASRTEGGRMFARVSSYQFPADQADQAVQAFNTAMNPVRQLDGAKGAYLLLDRSSGKALTITLWQSEEALRASEEAANKLRSDAAGSAGGTIQHVERYEVPLYEQF
jgi:heme-degrading monooxygenase HmoA